MKPATQCAGFFYW